jgi:SNF2 family DNA or RNA helicase
MTMMALESLSCDARLLITATPIQNNLSDLYTLVNFVCPGVLGDLATFRRDYERPISASSNCNATAEQKRRASQASMTLDEITKCIMLRRLQKDVLKKFLPPRHVFLLFCRPTALQCRMYKQITSKYNTSNVECVGPSPDALTALMGLRKICTHPDLLKCGEEDMAGGTSLKDCNVESSGKLTVLADLLCEIRAREPTDKVVIVSNFTSTLSVIEATILKPSNCTFQRLDGSTPSATRQTIVDTFNRTNSSTNFALTLSSKAGGTGLNIIGANRLIMVDPDWYVP